MNAKASITGLCRFSLRYPLVSVLADDRNYTTVLPCLPPKLWPELWPLVAVSQRDDFTQPCIYFHRLIAAMDGQPDGPISSIDEPGVKAEGQLLYEMRKEVAELLGRSQTSFPGAQPVSFSRQHLEELTKQE